MNLITEQEPLVAFCDAASRAEYVTVDTEFLRESTFYAKLCLVQMAFPGEGNAAVIDVLADGLDMTPVLEIFKNPSIVKVFHAARQDLEIFYHDYGILPKPFFDTQIAAMVDGYGDQVGYETLVRSIAKGKIDKSNRFTDWSRRPLSKAQLEYAQADVTYLRDVYEALNKELTDSGRIDWVQEELEALLDPELYDPDPERAWERVRARIQKPKFLAFVRELATFRETYARSNNVPRSRVFKDDALLEAAAQRPADVEALRKLRLWKGGVKGDVAIGAIKAIDRANKTSPQDYPQPPSRPEENQASESVIDLLRVYLKGQSDRNNVAQKLICTSAELEDFANDPTGNSPLNKGWRKQVFGDGAKLIVLGDAGLMSDGKYVKLVELNGI